MTPRERSFHSLQVAVYGSLALYGLSVLGQLVLMVAGEIATRWWR